MSIETRKWVVDHPHTHFAHPSQRGDLMDPHKTNTDLIELIQDLLNLHHIIYFTAINTDHHDDSMLGPHSHTAGYAFDCWPMKSDEPGDFVDAGSDEMERFLSDAGVDRVHYTTGLGGAAYTHDNLVASGSGVFQDDGEDHVHLSVA